MKGVQVSPAKRARAVELYAKLGQFRPVARHVGISVTAVRNAVRDALQAKPLSQRRIDFEEEAPARLRPMNTRDFAPRPLPVVDTSGRSYNLAPRRGVA